MVLDSYKFLQIPTVTSHFPASIKTWLPRQFFTLLIMAEGVESVPSFSSSVSTSLESVPTTSNVPVNHLADLSGESQSDEEENSESESHFEESSVSSEDGDDNEDTDLSTVLQALKARNEITEVLSHSTPSVTEIIHDAEKILRVLHEDCVCHQAHQGRPGAPSNLINLMSNITEQLEDYNSGSDVGPALHAARQVAYWSSVFISMVSSDAATIPSSNHAVATISSSLPSSSSQPLPIPTSASSQPTTTFTPPLRNQLPVSTSTTTVIPPSRDQPLSTTTTTIIPTTGSHPMFSFSTLSNPATTVIPPTGSHPTFSFSTLSNPATTVIPPTGSQPTFSFPTTTLTPSTGSQPAFSFPSTTLAPSTGSQSIFSFPTTTLTPSTGSQPTFSFPSTTLTPSTGTHPLQSSSATTDPATITMFREYGSASLTEWLDSLCIPRNIENLQQVKDLWEVGTVNCPPLHKWTVVMRNHRSNSGKNSSLFSQRKYIYNLFKNCNFDENRVFAQYNELRPGKLYKILNTKKK